MNKLHAGTLQITAGISERHIFAYICLITEKMPIIVIPQTYFCGQKMIRPVDFPVGAGDSVIPEGRFISSE